MITDRVDNVTKIHPEFRNAHPPAPISVKIELTARCDFQCFYCATGARFRSKGDIDWDFFCRITREMRDAGVEELDVFYLGESFLYERLPEAIAFAKKEAGFPYVFQTTNGRRAAPDRVRDEVEAETGHRCGLWALSIHYDGEQLDRMQEAVTLIEPYVGRHYWLPLYGQAGLTAGARGTKPVAGNVGRAGNMRDPLPCWSVFTEGHITYDGLLAACCFNHDGRFNMGDLNQMPFMEAWNSQVFQTLRQANLDLDVTGTACEKCIAYAEHHIDAPRAEAEAAL